MSKIINITQKLFTLLEELKAVYYQRIEVAHSPFLDSKTTACLDALIGKNKTLLEYGAGGSTLYASTKGTHVISVESSRRFARAVNRELSQLNATDSKVFSSNIGITRLWGTPIDRRPTKRNTRKWYQYVERPWKEADRRYTDPDIILVDGRFRTACTAYSALQIRKRNLKAVLLVDDFEQRPIYQKIFTVCDLVAMHGRAAELKAKQDIPEAEFEKLITDTLPDIL